MKTQTSISRFIAVSALAFGLSMTVPAFAAGHYGHGGPDRGAMQMQHGRGMPNLNGIDLSAAQVAQLSKLRDEARKQMREQGLALRDQHDALRKLTLSDAYTPAAAAEIIAKITSAQSEMAKQRAEQGNQLYKLLTPEQRTKMQQNELTGQRPAGRGNKR